jgi:N-acetylneuraminic acid mutarotase
MKKQVEWLHYCDDSANKFFGVFNIANLKEIPAWKFMIPYETNYMFDTYQISENIYFSGGGVPAAGSAPEQFFKVLIKLTIKGETESIKNKLADMNVPRAFHTLTALLPNCLYAIGGLNTTGLLNSCEEYQIDKNKWRQVASLNEKKKWVSVCSFAKRYIYAFGGGIDAKKTATNKIESFDTTDASSKQWKLVTLTSGAGLWKNCLFIGAFESPSEGIVLFGGYANDSVVDTCFMFDPIEKALKAAGNIQRKDHFYKSKVASNATQFAIVGSIEGDLHVFDKGKKTWTVNRKTMWNPLFVREFKADTF